MRPVMRKLYRIFAAITGLMLLLVLLMALAANSQTGQRFIGRSVAALTAGDVRLTGLSGRFPDAVTVGRLELRDTAGVWLDIDGLVLDWSPLGLLGGAAKINRLTAGRVALLRLPLPSTTPETGLRFSLPVTVIVDELHIGRLDLAAATLGKAASMKLDGSAKLAPLSRANLELDLQRLDAAGSYRLKADIGATGVDMALSVQEPPQGLLAGIAGLHGQYPLTITTQLAGPLSAIQTKLQLQSGPLSAGLQGLLDLKGEGTDLTLNAKSEFMQFLPALSWQTLNLDSRIKGQLKQPGIDGKLELAGLSVAGDRIGQTSMTLTGQHGQLHLNGKLFGLKPVMAQTDSLQRQPLTVQATIRLDLPDKPLDFALRHPVFAIVGKAVTAGNPHAELDLNLADLKPVAGLAGLDLQGSGTLRLHIARQGDGTQIDGDGSLAISGGDPVLTGLLGNQAKLVMRGRQAGSAVELSSLQLSGKNLDALAQAKLNGQTLSGDWRININGLSALSANMAGKLALNGQLSGAPDDFKLQADLTGDLGYQSGGRFFPRKPISGTLLLENLPHAASWKIKANAWLAGSPVQLRISAKKQTNAIDIAIEQADWKSAHAQGRLTLPDSGGVAAGNVDMHMARLDDLQPLLDLPLTGVADASLSTTVKNGLPVAQLQVIAKQLTLDGNNRIGQAVLQLAITDPIRHPQLDGSLQLKDLSAGQLAGTAQLAIAGTPEVLDLQWQSGLQTRTDTDVKLNAVARFNAQKRQLAVSQLQAQWRQQGLKLLAPLHIGFADGIGIDRLLMGLDPGKGQLELEGRVTPALAINAKLKHLPADFVARMVSDFRATGFIDADAKLSGEIRHPVGNISVNAAGLWMANANGRASPLVQLDATATLDGVNANLNGHANAGADAVFDITGQVPLDPVSTVKLHAMSKLNLKLSDPALNAEGRRLRGQVAIVADVAGSLLAPVLTGSLQLDKAELRDYGLGVNITGISGLLVAENGVLRIAKLAGRAGSGTISADGFIKLHDAGMPVELAVTARDARLLASDRLMVNLNADLALRGAVQGDLLALGSVLVNRAEIRIPERLPSSIAVLKIQSDTEPVTPPPASPNSRLGLNLVLDAPGQIFVRGRGLDAELYGTVRLRGTADQPQPEGGFKLRRGEYSLAGKALTFNQGAIGFDGGSLTKPFLHFLADTSSDNITATLSIDGSADKPVLSLSSVPALPQDEILARLLFKRSTANLSLLEMAQIGSALASLTGVDSVIGDPLAGVRKTLKLDRLSVGTSLEAGRYVIPGVYLGTKQGVVGNGTQAMIQIDLSKRLKVEATVGSGMGAASGKTMNTNSLGIVYQYEY